MKQNRPAINWSGNVWKCDSCGQYIGDDDQVINQPLQEHTKQCKTISMHLLRGRGSGLAGRSVVDSNLS